jgi:hypothetical protein
MILSLLEVLAVVCHCGWLEVIWLCYLNARAKARTSHHILFFIESWVVFPQYGIVVVAVHPCCWGSS